MRVERSQAVVQHVSDSLCRPRSDENYQVDSSQSHPVNREWHERVAADESKQPTYGEERNEEGCCGAYSQQTLQIGSTPNESL